jgi:hypothetical protein
MQNHQGYPLMTSDLVGKPSLEPKSPKNPLKPLVEVIPTPLHYRPSFAQTYQTHQSMQTHQGYPLMTSNRVGKPSIVPKSPKNPLKPLVEVIGTLLYTHPSFAQGSPIHQSVQNHQGYPLITSNLMSKPSLLPRSPKNYPKPSVEVIVNPLYSHPSFAQRYQTHQSMPNHQGYPLMTSDLVGKPSIVPKSSKNPLKPQVEVVLTPRSSRPSFAQRFPTRLSMKNHQGYPLITSNLIGKPSLLLRSAQNPPPKPSVDVMETSLYTQLSFAQISPTNQSMQNQQGYPMITSNRVGKPYLLLKS